MVEIMLVSKEGQRFKLECKSMDEVSDTVLRWRDKYVDYQQYGYEIETIKDYNS
tara:strand:+ start:498 stop:659 length:162 start_codon:yes stop_codon:yes gene_type:complete